MLGSKKQTSAEEQIENFISWMLKSFEDQRIISKLKEIVLPTVPVNGNVSASIPDNNKYPDDEAKCKQLKDELDAKNIELQDVKTELKNLKEELKKAVLQVQKRDEEFTQAEAKAVKLQKQFDGIAKQYNELAVAVKPFQAAFDKYRSLTPKVKNLLQGIFPNEDLYGFIFCGIREDNLTSLWDFCANTIKNGGDNLKELMELFDFFFEWNHRQYGSPKYKRLTLKVSDKFNEDTAQRDRTSVPIGKIETVIFQGFAYASNDKLVRKSIVHVG